LGTTSRATDAPGDQRDSKAGRQHRVGCGECTIRLGITYIRLFGFRALTLPGWLQLDIVEPYFLFFLRSSHHIDSLK
jgi:hypothetical protein